MQPKVHGEDTIEIEAWYKVNPTPPPHQLPEVEAEITQELRDMASALAGADLLRQRECWWDLSIKLLHSNHRQRRNAGHSSTDLAHQDYLLHDVTNGFISVEGSFLRFWAPGDGYTRGFLEGSDSLLHQLNLVRGWNYSYGELLPENPGRGSRSLGRSSPQIRAIFAPTVSRAGLLQGALRHGGRRGQWRAPSTVQFCPGPAAPTTRCLRAMTTTSARGLHGPMQPAGDAVRIRVQPGVRGIAVRTLPGELFAAVPDIMSGASALFNVSRRVQIRDGVVSNWVGNLGTAYANANHGVISHMKTVTLGPFLGINNRLPNFALHVATERVS